MGGDWESAWPLQQKHIAGDCIDLATERQNVKDYIIGAINRYLDMGVDALRIDTVKHIERDNCSNTSTPGRRTSRGCSSSARTWSRATAGATWAAATTARRRSGRGGTPG